MRLLGSADGKGTAADPGVAGHSAVRTFINGTSQTNVYSRGSKDTIDFPANNFAINGSPNKDTINAGYAAAYNSNGDFLVMFGGDRASPNGSSFIGIWFLQQSVKAGSNGNFIGAHTDHDVFVISNFASRHIRQAHYGAFRRNIWRCFSQLSDMSRLWRVHAVVR